MIIEAPSYHAHLYFRDDERETAEAVHAQAGQALAAIATVWPMRDRPVGPHSRPMFEIEFQRANREAVVGWVEAHRQGLTVLLHPETGDDLIDHRDHAVWLGEPLPLDYSRL